MSKDIIYIEDLKFLSESVFVFSSILKDYCGYHKSESLELGFIDILSEYLVITSDKLNSMLIDYNDND
ncbi:MAG: hypothetical protein PHX18_05100 [Candidatus Gastranaerophilales bacterium]|nr:hypothetical protein [Candidatus Gastranaerophilales bacterium]